MTVRTLHRWSTPFLLFVAATVVVRMTTADARGLPADDKSVFVSVLDQSRKPVKDMKLEEFLLREDGTDREIVAVRPATQPLTVELLADTSAGADEYLQDIRKALTAFVRTVQTAIPNSAIQLMEFGQAARPVAPFTTSTADLEKGINRLTGKPGAGSVLLEAICTGGQRAREATQPEAGDRHSESRTQRRAKQRGSQQNLAVPAEGWRAGMGCLAPEGDVEESEARFGPQRDHEEHGRAA